MSEYIVDLGEALYNEQTGECVFQPTFKGKLIRCHECIHSRPSESLPEHILACEYRGIGIVNDEFYCGNGEANN